jgi:predicted  nucleic acid-binding Zn-ribbon protein
VATAPPADQLRLLDVQELDTRAQQLAHQRKNLPEHARIAELDAQLEDLRGKLVESRTAVSDLKRELKKAEGDVEQVRTRATRDQARLDAGQVGAKDAQALVAELESLARRQGVLEEVELDVMERLEAHEEALAKLDAAHAELESAKAEVVAARDARYAELDAQAAEVASKRGDAVAGLDAGLVALYERVRDQNGGRGVVALRGQRLEGLNVDLSRAELATITSTAPDQVVRLEDYGHIVVRPEGAGA